MSTSTLFFHKNGAAANACSFAWDKAQEYLWPFFAFAVGWAGLYGGLALTLLVSTRPLVGIAARAIATAGAVFFTLWFSSVSLDIARGKQPDLRMMARSLRFVFSPAVLVHACLSFCVVVLMAFPGILVMSFVASLSFLAPVFVIALAIVSWLYILTVFVLHANLGFALVGHSDIPALPKRVSWNAVYVTAKAAWDRVTESRSLVERNWTQYVLLWAYGAIAFVLGSIPSVVTLGAGFIFLIFFFGIALARMYVGAHRINVPVSRE